VDKGIAICFRDLDARRGWVVSTTTRPLYPRERPVLVQEAGWAPGLVWTFAKNLAPTGIRSPDRPARSQSLYRLSYPDITFTFTVQCKRGRHILLGTFKVCLLSTEKHYLLTPWSRVLLEKLTGLQLVKKFSAFY
jgi:hypothetical protein